MVCSICSNCGWDAFACDCARVKAIPELTLYRIRSIDTNGDMKYFNANYRIMMDDVGKATIYDTKESVQTALAVVINYCATPNRFFQIQKSQTVWE